MADRTVEITSTEVPEMPEILEKVLLFALTEAKEKAVAGQDVIPFTALVVKDNLFLETHPGETAEECFAFAQHTVQGARGAEGHAISFLYTEGDDGLSFEEEPAYVGEAPNFMIALKDASEYGDDEIDDRYLDDEDAEAAGEPADEA